MGFSSPAQDYYEKETDTLSLDQHLIHRPSATFFGFANGSSMTEAGINDGAILVLDRSLSPASGDIVVVILDGELLCRRFLRSNKRVILTGNSDVPAIEISNEQDFELWGVVSAAVNQFRKN